MSIKAFLRSRKYLKRILIIITLSILLLMCLFSVALYVNIEQRILDYEYKNATNLLQQMKFSIKTVQGILKEEAVRTFFNSDVTNLMYLNENDIDYSDYQERIDRITKDLTVLNKFVYSMYLFNSTQGKVLQIINHPYAEDLEFIKSVEKGKSFPKLKPIIREITFANDKEKKKEKVLTYFMYQSVDQNNRLDGAVIMNIKSDWLMDNIKQINSIDMDGNVYIIDENGNYLNADNSKEDLGELLKKKLVEWPSNEKVDIIEEHINGVLYFITYTRLEDSSLILVKTQPADMVYKNVDSIKKTIILVAMIFILIAVIISVTISERIYKPVRNLFDRVTGDENNTLKPEAESGDEILYLEEFYKESMERIKDFNRKRVFYKDITKTYWLQKFLTEGINLDRQKYNELATENAFQITYDGYFSIMILKIDNYLDFINKNDLMGRNLIKFAVMNIVGEIISEKFLNDCIDMRDDHIAVIMNLKNDKLQEFFTILEGLLRKVQDNIDKYYGISVTASVSDIVPEISNLTGLYSNAVANSVYRFAFGKSSYITPEKIKSNINNVSLNFMEKHETKLIESIRSRNIEKSEYELIEIIHNLKNINYDSMFLSVVRLTDIIKKTIEQMSNPLTSENLLLYSGILKKITTLETIDEFYIIIDNYLKQTLEHKANQEIDPRNTLIIETVKDVILSKYNEPGLCLQQIAEMIKIHPRRLSSIFKELEHISISEYINEVRLVKVAHLLETTRLNVNEVIEKVGISNETYFYSIFRKKYGMTPKEYAVQKNMNNMLSNFIS